MNTRIHIKNLRLRTYIGFNDEEQIKKQDVVINIDIEYDAIHAMTTDRVEDAFNYKVLTKKIISLIESSRYNLLEKMAADIMHMIQAEEPITAASIEIDKPHALRFSDSVSFAVSWEKDI